MAASLHHGEWTRECDNCGEISDNVYRCTNCGTDLTDSSNQIRRNPGGGE